MGRGLDGFTLLFLAWCSFQASPRRSHGGGLDVFGGNSEGETPLPIPNRAVKPLSADGTWDSRPWESRSPPVFFRPQRAAQWAAFLRSGGAVRVTRPGVSTESGAQDQTSCLRRRATGVYAQPVESRSVCELRSAEAGDLAATAEGQRSLCARCYAKRSDDDRLSGRRRRKVERVGLVVSELTTGAPRTTTTW